MLFHVETEFNSPFAVHSHNFRLSLTLRNSKVPWSNCPVKFIPLLQIVRASHVRNYIFETRRWLRARATRPRATCQWLQEVRDTEKQQKLLDQNGRKMKRRRRWRRQRISQSPETSEFLRTKTQKYLSFLFCRSNSSRNSRANAKIKPRSAWKCSQVANLITR